MPKYRLWLTIFITALIISPAEIARSLGEAEQRRIIEEYLIAYARNDYAKLRPRLPARDENIFGPYLFDGMPRLSQPKIDDNKALVEFTAKVKDDKFPQKGGVLLMKRPGGWLVRQVLFYEKVPAVFNLPKRSITEQDRKFEPIVTDICEEFLKAWQRGDTAGVVKRSHRWMDRDDDLNKGMSVSHFELNADTTRWGEPFARYKARLTYRWGILSYSMKFDGGFIMVKEDGIWKVRGNVMVLYF
jgi:hypothetical protein